MSAARRATCKRTLPPLALQPAGQIPNSSSTSKVAAYANGGGVGHRDARQRYSGCIEAANLDKIETICEAGGERARYAGTRAGQVESGECSP